MILQVAVALGLGLANPGPLATEATHYVRITSNGADPQLSVSAEAMLTDWLGVAARASMMPSILYRWPIEEKDIDSRWSHRPGPTAEAWPLVWSHVALGVRAHASRWLDASVGLSASCISAISYHRVGASPMCRPGGWLEGRASLPFRDGAFVLAIGATPMPGGNCSSWTVLYEMTGAKRIEAPSPEHGPDGECLNPRIAVWPVYAELQFEVRR